MATAFPAELDVLQNPVAGTKQDNPAFYHDVVHANINDCLEAIEAKVGKDNSAVTTSIDYRLRAVETGLGSLVILSTASPVDVINAPAGKFCFDVINREFFFNLSGGVGGWIFLFQVPGPPFVGALGGGGTGTQLSDVDPEGVVTSKPGGLCVNVVDLTFWLKLSGEAQFGWDFLFKVNT